MYCYFFFFFFSSRRRHTRCGRDWSSDVCSSDLEKYALRAREMAPLNARFVPFSAQTRMSGIDVDGVSIRKGAVDAIIALAEGGSTGPLWRGAAGGAQAALRVAPVSDAVRQVTSIA